MLYVLRLGVHDRRDPGPWVLRGDVRYPRAVGDGDIEGAIIPAWAIFSLIIIAFLIKLPVIPFHTWLPDAHTDAPTAVSVILAGVLLKMGGYGILRLAFNIMPEQARDADVFFAMLAAASIIYGAVMTLIQTDLKRLIAYSS